MPVEEGEAQLFTAEWAGTWTVVRGTGRFRGATGSVEVEAENPPFSPFDPQWLFTWEWETDITIPTRVPCISLVFTTDGLGVFRPANLGLGDPNIPFPFIIGDGSGEGIYDGTPIGFNFRLNGVFLGPDRHFGNSQSLSPGLFSPEGKVWFPVVSGRNPIRPGRDIHIMRTLFGEIWFKYSGFFELDADESVLGLADFRIIGGTGIFAPAEGSVLVTVTSDGLLPNEQVPTAPFAYDFVGYLEYCLRDR